MRTARPTRPETEGAKRAAVSERRVVKMASVGSRSVFGRTVTRGGVSLFTASGFPAHGSRACGEGVMSLRPRDPIFALSPQSGRDFSVPGCAPGTAPFRRSLKRRQSSSTGRYWSRSPERRGSPMPVLLVCPNQLFSTDQCQQSPARVRIRPLWLFSSEAAAELYLVPARAGAKCFSSAPV